MFPLVAWKRRLCDIKVACPRSRRIIRCAFLVKPSEGVWNPAHGFRKYARPLLQVLQIDLGRLGLRLGWFQETDLVSVLVRSRHIRCANCRHAVLNHGDQHLDLVQFTLAHQIQSHAQPRCQFSSGQSVTILLCRCGAFNFARTTKRRIRHIMLKIFRPVHVFNPAIDTLDHHQDHRRAYISSTIQKVIRQSCFKMSADRPEEGGSTKQARMWTRFVFLWQNRARLDDGMALNEPLR